MDKVAAFKKGQRVRIAATGQTGTIIKCVRRTVNQKRNNYAVQIDDNKATAPWKAASFFWHTELEPIK